MKYQCLVLDHDDTVVNSTPMVHYPSFSEAVSILRPERERMTLEQFLGYSFAPGIMSLFRDELKLDDAEMAIEQEIWRKWTDRITPEPFPGMARLIQRFKAAGGRICVASHSETPVIERAYREKVGLLPDRIYGWDLPEAQRKPAPHALDDAMHAFGLRPEQMLVVDDLKPGLDMARSRGVDFAWAGWSELRMIAEKHMCANADYCFDTVDALEAFVFQ